LGDQHVDVRAWQILADGRRAEEHGQRTSRSVRKAAFSV
jgi:hypothetical protein